MTAPRDLVTLVCAIGFIVLNLYYLGLWIYALHRTRLGFCYILVATGAVGVFLSVINVVLYCDPYVGVRGLGLPGWKVFYYLFVCIQPINVVASYIGFTLLVAWMTRRV
jgi:hypothetical protein